MDNAFFRLPFPSSPSPPRRSGAGNMSPQRLGATTGKINGMVGRRPRGMDGGPTNVFPTA